MGGGHWQRIPEAGGGLLRGAAGQHACEAHTGPLFRRYTSGHNIQAPQPKQHGGCLLGWARHGRRGAVRLQCTSSSHSSPGGGGASRLGLVAPQACQPPERLGCCAGQRGHIAATNPQIYPCLAVPAASPAVWPWGVASAASRQHQQPPPPPQQQQQLKAAAAVAAVAAQCNSASKEKQNAAPPAATWPSPSPCWCPARR